ncbi:MAG: AAA family ATPase [Bacteroidota bacterium]|nr:AAA family ATPase [Bacteroidota bacterium]
MKIIEVDIKTPKDNLLPAVVMNKLGKHVVIAGKNGAGKTRLLNLIRYTLNIYPNKKQEANWKAGIQQRGIENTLGEQQALLAKNQLILDSEKKEDHFYFIDLFPRNFNLKIHFDSSPNELENAYRYYKEFDFQHERWATNESPALCYLAYVQNHYFEALYQNEKYPNQLNESIVAEYNALQALLEIFLETRLERDSDGSGGFMLFGRKQGASDELSNGQKVLLHICLVLHAKGLNIHGLILFVDEPENHLHPAILIETINKISQLVSNGQLWIATHSVNLVAHLQDASLFYMKNGKIQSAYKNPESIVNGLLGNKAEQQKLTDFIAMPFRYTEMKFAEECLESAIVVMTTDNDKQTKQVREVIKNYSEIKGAIKVLDFGAGKGRLISNIDSNEKNHGTKTNEWLDYVAYDFYKTDAEECKFYISQVYSDSTCRYYNNIDEIEKELGNQVFDFVILLNVFHEMNPNSWLENFAKGGKLDAILKPNGYILIVEHQILHYGEQTPDFGFLMFDQPEFEIFFQVSVKNEKDYFVYTDKNNPKLKAHCIHRKFIGNVNEESKTKAIKELRDHSMREIENIRNKKLTGAENGRLFGFWLQSLANAMLALKQCEIK